MSWIRCVSDFDDDPTPPSSSIAEIVADPQAARWARDCARVPGYGHCRNRPYSTVCLFHVQRAAEAAFAGRITSPR